MSPPPTTHTHLSHTSGYPGLDITTMALHTQIQLPPTSGCPSLNITAMSPSPTHTHVSGMWQTFSIPVIYLNVFVIINREILVAPWCVKWVDVMNWLVPPPGELLAVTLSCPQSTRECHTSAAGSRTTHNNALTQNLNYRDSSYQLYYKLGAPLIKTFPPLWIWNIIVSSIHLDITVRLEKTQVLLR